MKKTQILMTIAAVAAAAVLTSCVHCNEPMLDAGGKILDECNVNSHKTITDVDPNSLALVRPGILPSKDYFRPQFRSGTRRVQAEGAGKTLKQARENALKNFLKENECDFIVAVNFRNEGIQHPQKPFWRWFFRGGKNWKTTLCGIPVTLVALEKEEIKEPEPPKADIDIDKKLEVIVQKIEDTKKETEQQIKLMHRPGLLKLKDIDISVKAKGETPDDTGVFFPALPCEKVVCEGHEAK